MQTKLLFLNRFVAGLLVLCLTAALYVPLTGLHVFDIKVLNSMLLVAAAYCLSALSVNKIQRFPGHRSWIHILPAVGISFSAVFGLFGIFFVRFSNSFVLFSGLVCAAFFVADSLWRFRRKPVLAYIPLGRCAVLAEHLSGEAVWYRLPSARVLVPETCQAVVADLGCADLTDVWQKYLAQCALLGIPVYHVRQVEESLTGRSKIRYLYENDLGALLPPPAYLAAKSLLDVLFVLLLMPVVLPLMLLTAVAVRLDSPGSVFFTQKRVGRGGREFVLYKFRSMRTDSEAQGARFAGEGDMRITRVGRFIRKTRLDELPQFFNILKGEMSLIGPRPEQKVFVERFERAIPFYGYRHIVKPGISGWAQVMQGYAADEESTQTKVEYDFYYIKNFSFSLDVLIFFKTIKTMLTGFGAR